MPLAASGRKNRSRIAWFAERPYDIALFEIERRDMGVEWSRPIRESLMEHRFRRSVTT
jgi:hypothetical protein